MARKVTKQCPACKQLFVGRRDAKTCSDRCRKRMQRAVAALAKEAEVVEKKVETAAESAAEKIEVLVKPAYATEGGFVGDDTGTTPTVAPAPVAQPAADPPAQQNVPVTPAPPVDQPQPAPQPPVNQVPVSPPEPQPVPVAPPPEATIATPDTSQPVADSLEDFSQDIQTPFTAATLAEAPVVGAAQSEQTEYEEPRRNYSWLLRLVSYGAFALFVLISSAAAIFIYLHGQNKKTPANTKQPDLSSLLSSGSTATANGNSLHINFDTVIDNGRQLTATGPVIIQNATDSTSGFAVQNATGNTLLVADTVNQKVGINGAPTNLNAALQVTGNIATNGSLVSTGNAYSLSNRGLTIGGVLVCTSSGCASSTPIPSFPNIDTAHLAYLNLNQTFTGDNNFSGVNTFTNANSFSGNDSFSGNNSYTGTNSFAVTSATAFSVQNAAANDNLFVVNTTNGVVGIGMAPTPAGAPLQVNGNLNLASGAYQVGGTSGATFTCSSGDLLSDSIIQGGIITGGTCALGSGAAIATLQQTYNASLPATVVLNASSGVLALQDASTPLGTNLFEVDNNGGSTKYFAVDSSGVSVGGTINSTGNIYQNGNQVCDLSGNCAGVGGGVTTTGGTANQLAKFTGTQTIGDSIISDNGTTAAVAGTLNATTLQQGGTNVLLQSTSFSGDLSGTYNATSVDKLKGTSLSITSLADTNYLVYNSTTGNWENHSFSGDITVDHSGVATIANGAVTSAKIADGTIAAVDLSSTLANSLAYLANNQTFTGSNTFSGAVTANGGVTTSGTSLGVGATTAALNLQGNLSSNLAVTDGTYTITVGFSGTPTGSITYNFDNTAAAGTYDICTTAGNCVGSGGSGAIGGSGTLNQLAKFTPDGYNVGSSAISDDGSTVTVTEPVLAKSTSATAFQIQNSLGGGNLFVADTSSTEIGIGKVPTLGTLDVNGSIYQSGNQVCDTSGNCTGVAGGAIGGGGTGGTIAVFTGSGSSYNIGDSILTQSGTTVAAAGSLNVTGQYQVGGSQISSADLSNNSDLAKISGANVFTNNNTFNNNITAPGITAGGAALGIGASSDTLDLAGTLSSNWSVTNGTNTTTIGFAGATPTTGTINYNFDTTAAAGTYNICTTAGNCTGGAGGAIGGGGTGGTIAVFTGSGSSYNIGDSILTQSGTTVAAAGSITSTGTYNTNTFTSSALAFGATTAASVQSAAGQDLTLDSGTTGALNVGTGSNAKTITLGNSTGATSLTINAGTGGLSLGDSAIANTIQIGNTTGAVAQTINIGNNATAASTNTVVLGSTIGSSTTTINGGTGNINLSPDGSSNTGVLVKPANNSTAAFQVQNAGSNSILAVDTSGGIVNIGKASNITSNITLYNAAGTGSISLQAANPTSSNYTITIPAETGTICTTAGSSACTSIYGSSGGSTPTLANVYSNGVNQTDETIALDSTRNGILIQDSSGGIGGTLFGVQNSTGLTKYLDVTASGISVTGTVVASGNVNATGGAIQTNSITRLDGSGNLSNIGNLTATGASTFTAGGANGFTFKPGTDNTAVFQVQNASNNNLLAIDSTNANITLDGLAAGNVSSWSTGTPLTAGRNNITAVTANGYIYVLGGDNGGSAQSTIYYARVNTDGSVAGTWTTASNPLPLTRDSGSAVVYNNYIYYLGGLHSSANWNTVYYARLNPSDGSIGTWNCQGSSSSDCGITPINGNIMPGKRDSGTAVVANGYIYYIGGLSSSTAQTNVYYAKLNADGSTGAWTSSGNILGQGRDKAASVYANGYVYVIAGNSGGTARASTFFAALSPTDGSVGAWSCQGSSGDCGSTAPTNSTALPSTRDSGSSAVSNGYVYYMGGLHGGSNYDTTYFAKLNADGTVGAWSCQGANSTDCGTTPFNNYVMPGKRDSGAEVTVNGYIYYMGGLSGGAAQSTVYYTSTPRLKVGANLDLVGLQGSNLNSGGDISSGSTGGSITAGNITAVGALQVQGQGSFAQNLSAGGNLTVNGSALFQNLADSTTALQVQDSSSTTILGVDTSTPSVNIASTAKLTFDGGAGNEAIFNSSNDLIVGNYSASHNVQVQAANFEFQNTTDYGVNLLINNTGQTTFQNSSDSTTAFQIQNTAGTSLMSVDTSTTPNLISNNGFEVDTTGWAAKNGATLTRITSPTYSGVGALQVSTTATVGDGAYFSYTFTASQQYTLSLYARAASGLITDINIGRQDNGSDIDCLTGQTLSTSWVRYSCTFTTGSTISGSNIYIKETGGSSETFYIDGVQLETGSYASPYNPGGTISLNGVIASPTAFSDGVSIGSVQGLDDRSLLYSGQTVQSKLSIGQVITDVNSGSFRTVENYTVLDPSATLSSNVLGADNIVSIASGNSQNITGVVIGAQNDVTQNGSGTYSELRGASNNVDQNSGTVDYGYGSKNSYSLLGGTVVSLAAGAYNLLNQSANVTLPSNGVDGAYNLVNITSGVTSPGTAYRAALNELYNDASGTLSYAVGNNGSIFNTGAGTVTYAEGLEGHVTNSGTGTVTNAYGVKVLAATSSGGGTITNNYGLYSDYQSVGTNNYPLYLAGSTNPILSVTGEGATTFRNNTDSTAALQIQNSSGSTLLTADTTNSQVTIDNSAGNAASDEFNSGTSPGSQWTLYTDDSTTTSISGGDLVFNLDTAATQHDCWTGGSGNYTNCLRLVENAPSSTSGNMEINTEIMNTVPNASSGTGVIVWQDATHFLRFELQNNSGTLALVNHDVIGATGYASVSSCSPPSTPFYLRVLQLHYKWTFSYSTNAIDYTTCGSVDVNSDLSYPSFAPTKVGLFVEKDTTSWTTNLPTYNYFRVFESALSVQGGIHVTSSDQSNLISLNDSTNTPVFSINEADSNWNLYYRGAALFKPTTNSANAFQVQDNSGNDVLNIDSGNGYVCIDTSSCSHALGVNGAGVASGGFSTGTPDVAEYIDAASNVTAADIVVADPANNESVKRTSTPYDPAVIGVIANGTSGFQMLNPHYGQSFNALTDTPDASAKPMTVTGRVPVHVTGEGGPIQPGDYLTTSSTPGYAMKATHGGPVVGKALGTFSGTTSSDQGTVLVLVSIGYYAPEVQLQGSTADVNTLTVATLTVNSNATFKGDIIIQGHIIGNSDTSGTVTVTAGQSTATYTFNKAYTSTPKVVVSPDGDVGSLHWWVTKSTTDFTVHLSGAAPNNMDFDYLVQQ